MIFFKGFVLWNIFLNEISVIYSLITPFEISNNHALLTTNQNSWSALLHLNLLYFQIKKKKTVSCTIFFFLIQNSYLSSEHWSNFCPNSFSGKSRVRMLSQEQGSRRLGWRQMRYVPHPTPNSPESPNALRRSS